MPRLRSVHAVVGVLAVVLFVASGQYMDLAHQHMRNTPDVPRLLFRSAHIYLLLAGLCNLALGMYLHAHAAGMRRVLQLAGSALLIVAPFSFAWSFFSESLPADLDRPFASIGAYASLAGVALHVLSFWRVTERRDAS